MAKKNDVGLSGNSNIVVVNCDKDLFQEDLSLKSLNNIAKRPHVNIKFNDIGYTVRSIKGDRRILHNVSGEFQSGQLSCILGPSGAGKSTLLNILTGYITNGVNGYINVNGHACDMKVFKKLSCYIMQDDLLQPKLTVLESMQMAADLKLGEYINKADKNSVVSEILQALGLWKSRHTMRELLSGGELKRLSIALELLNNPPVIFLDEPTSGLDIVSVRKLMVLLRSLSRQGRTVICTIHQPSAALFQLFDKAYVVCNGICCYQGAPTLLIPFLAQAGYVCPITYNPADFVIETLVELPCAVARMSDLCQNGKICKKFDQESSSIECTQGTKNKNDEQVIILPWQKCGFPSSFTTQFHTLIKRMYIQGRRNKVAMLIQLFHHTICAFMIGGIFYQIGNEGSVPVVHFKLYLSVLVFFVYTNVMTPILLFPSEVRIVQREYFNRWYGLKAFYAAITCANIPKSIIFGMIFISVTYVLTGQPLEWDRFIFFSISAILIGFCSEGFGLVIGSACNVTNGSIAGPACVAPLLALCCYGIGFGTVIEPIMKFLMYLSYLRYGLVGLTLPMYENRPKMHCSEDMCPYAHISLFLRDIGMAGDRYYLQIIGLLLFTLLYRLLAYYLLRCKLTTEYSNKFMIRISQFLNYD